MALRLTRKPRTYVEPDVDDNDALLDLFETVHYSDDEDLEEQFTRTGPRRTRELIGKYRKAD